MLPGPGIDCEAEIQPVAASRGSRISPGDADPSKRGPPAYRLGVDVSISEVELLQSYVRFDTTKPPGHERACIEFVGGLLEQARIEHRYVALEVERPNLVARIPGRGEAAPHLLPGRSAASARIRPTRLMPRGCSVADDLDREGAEFA